MEAWKQDPNKRALAIVRRSSSGQKDNTSAETQEREIREYTKQNGLDLIKLEPIIETAYQPEARKKYQALMKFALSQGIKHILFYIGSREARNLTDNEVNERLIKEDKIVVHHVSEGKVFSKDSPDSDFLLRDIQTAVNKNSSRENGTRVKNSFRTKAEMGWFPYRHTPLGYTHHKEKDRFGNSIKGTATIIADPISANVKLVQREFELRAQGFSYDLIRKSNLDAGLVPKEQIRTYHRSSIEKRLKNSFYWGAFQLTGDPEIFTGIHEKIIPKNILSAVKAINGGHGCKIRKTVGNGDDIFRGWLTCAHPECMRQITQIGG
jgi:DNA invertase Pin-like site-specific DNA recombinase